VKNRSGKPDQRDRSDAGESLVGAEFEAVIGKVAHGGHCVTRYDARVVFVRHTLPGEKVRVRVTDGRAGDRFLLGDAIEASSRTSVS